MLLLEFVVLQIDSVCFRVGLLPLGFGLLSLLVFGSGRLLLLGHNINFKRLR